ncbi:DUF1722 domain-containing protein [Shimwellia pseudoproteus]|uniref:YbgA family protein n=1 Tax=Shimwellia pseudoproteus TaxID=570012 RepID=UPI0018EB63B8|nr:DUF523 and DUF1722 domain-containing protein [Shimwellia pseudoproteus]MBJ3814503.1 DUF1722 domain-containing protein [Shimwellia pseudoproteus]
MSGPIPVGISACLLGQAVRFDGGHKSLSFARDALAPWVHFEPVCPEMAIGLPVPRPALRLIEQDSAIRLVYSNRSPGDLTQQMQHFARQQTRKLHHLCGYIVCAKSPSCGLERVRIYDPDGKNNRKAGTGIFTAELQQALPWLPIEEDGRLTDPAIRENFVERICALYELNQVPDAAGRVSRGAMMAFHSRYKLLLLAHSQPDYRALGRFVAQMHQWPDMALFFAEYRLRVMALLAHHATRRNHTNVLMHVQGYFRPQLTSRQRQELATLIDHYRQGLQPLLAPLALLRHYMAEYPNDYLAQQRYFDPYPAALRLRYGY